jgi:tetratricopeptide (TPR) repeat protein
MKFLHTTVFAVALCAGSAFAQQAAKSATDQFSSPGETVVQEKTPAQQSISAAQLQINADPKKVSAYNQLALAYLRRSRETADLKYLKDAETALDQGLKLDTSDFQLQRTRVALLLARHEFVQAKEKATSLHLRTPDDVMTYGYIAEADIALGDYPDAERNAQWMMDLRPYNTPALLLGATLRNLYGDTRGAIEFLNRAFAQTSPAEVEEQAWIANQIAVIEIDSGQNDAANQILEQADRIFPRYVYTVENSARLRTAQKRVDDTLLLWMQAVQLDSNPHVLYELARAQEASGHSSEARPTYAQFEKLATDPATATHEAKLDLIQMYASNPTHTADALRLAQREMEARQDLWTLDAYAWALYANTRFQDADAAVQKALAVGIQSAQIFNHAGHIAQKLNHAEDAARCFQLAMQSNPTSEYAADAGRSSGTVVAAEVSLPIDSHATPKNAASDDGKPQVDPAPQNKSNLNEAPAVLAIASEPSSFTPVPEKLLTPRPTVTAQTIRTAQAVVGRNPRDPSAYTSLGAAYLQRARETGNVSDFELAEKAETKSLDLDSADFSADAALGTMAAVCMGEHRFSDALNYAQGALALGTGDVSPFAIVGDAYADMGEYKKAGEAYGRLTPHDMILAPRAAYARDSRLAYLKFIAGDTPGAVTLMRTAVSEGSEAQLPAENLAWLYYELGEFLTQAGDVASADAVYLSALTIHPGDFRALAALGKLRANIGRYPDAIVLYQKAIAIVPMPTFIAELGDVYARTGNQSEAKKQYDLVEYIGLLGHINQVLHNRDLALFYADHGIKLDQALELARKEFEVRHDIYTWDALAWALFKNGKINEAAEVSEKALQFGTRDPLLLFHAGMIDAQLGRHEAAQRELGKALQINPHFHMQYAEVAQQRLTLLSSQISSREGTQHAAR